MTMRAAYRKAKEARAVVDFVDYAERWFSRDELVERAIAADPSGLASMQSVVILCELLDREAIGLLGTEQMFD